MKKNFFSTVAGATILISILGIAAKGFGFLREIIYAGYFGLKSDFESFLVGYVLPITINTAVLYLGQNYFIPEFSKVKVNNPGEADSFLNKNIRLFFISGFIAGLVLYIFAGFIIDNYLHNSSPVLQNTALNIFRILILTIPLNAVFSIISAYLQTEFRFTHPALAQLLMNVFVIVFVLMFTGLWGIYSIPFGILLGSFIQLFYLMWIIREKLTFNFKELFTNPFSFSGFGKPLLMIVFMEVINQLHVVIDRYFINSVDSGGIAGLNYAITVYVMPLSIFSFALSSAIFPQLTKLFGNNQIDELNKQFLKALKINSFVFIPVSAIFIFYGDVVIRVFYQRGSFGAGDTLLTASLLRIFAYSLLFYSAFSVINKLVFTLGLVKKLLVISVSALFLKVLLNFILAGIYKQDGLAYSSTICYIYMSIAGYLIVIKKVSFSFTGVYLQSMAVDVINALISFFLSSVIYNSLLTDSLAGKILTILLFCLFFVLNAILIKTEEIEIFKQLIYQNILKGRGKGNNNKIAL